ncbi:MAG TPA: ribosome recycling factor [Candidatus Eisenbacteria bacterium]
MSAKEVLSTAEEKMKKSVETVRHEFTGIRTGKATAALLDTVKVDYYGSMMPVNQVASISVPEPRLLVVQPWEKAMLQPIARAIQASDLGLNPQDDGSVLKIPVPTLNEDRRKDLVKLVKKFAEEGRVAIRNVRHHANDELKKALKDKTISEDDEKRAMADCQKITDKYVGQIDELIAKKEAEVMEV